MTTLNVHVAVWAVASVTETVTGTVHPASDGFAPQLNIVPEAGLETGACGFMAAPTTCVWLRSKYTGVEAISGDWIIWVGGHVIWKAPGVAETKEKNSENNDNHRKYHFMLSCNTYIAPQKCADVPIITKIISLIIPEWIFSRCPHDRN